MITTASASLNRSSSIAHPTNARFGLRENNSRSITSGDLKVKI